MDGLPCSGLIFGGRGSVCHSLHCTSDEVGRPDLETGFLDTRKTLYFNQSLNRHFLSTPYVLGTVLVKGVVRT